MAKNKETFQILSSPVFWIALIVTGTFIAYLPALQGVFTNWDDMMYVRDNPYIKSLSLSNLSEIFSTNHMGNYHPLAMLSLAIDYQIYKFNPFGFHLTNLLLHIANSVLVFVLLSRISGKITVGAFAGLIFGVHAFHVESVAWISERKDVLYTLFFLFSLIAYHNHVKGHGIKWLVFSLGLFLLSCLSKGQAVSLAFSVVLIDIFAGRKLLSAKVLVEKVPFFIIALIFGIVAIRAQAGADATIMANFPIQQRIAFASYGLVMYVLKMVVPYSLSAYYPYPIVSAGDEVPFIYWVAILPALALIVAWVLSFNRSKPLFFGLGFFLANIVLLLQLLPVGRAIMADRYVYIPSIGFCFLAGWYLSEAGFFRSKWLPVAIVLGYSLLLGTMTFARSKVWKNSDTLWSDVIEKDPRVPVAWYNRGNIRLDSGDYQRAVEDYTECLNIDKGYLKAYINRGSAKNELKNYLGAISDFDAALQLDSSSLNTYVNRAHSRRMLKDYDNSLKDYNRALALKPEQVELYTSRSNLKYDMKDYQGAIADLDQALSLRPDYVVGYTNRAYIRKAAGDLDGALADYNKAIELDQGNSEYYNNRGNLRFQMNDSEGAIGDYSSSITLSPDQYLGYKNRGVAYLVRDDFQKALNDFTQASKLNPSSGELFYNIALAKRGLKDDDGAVTAYKKAIELDPVYISDEFRIKAGISQSLLSDLEPEQMNRQGKALEAKGLNQEAISYYLKAVAAKQDFAEAWYNLGNVYGKTGKFSEAMNCLNNAIRYRSNYPEALSSRGIAFASMGKVNEALADLSASIQADPKYAAAYYNRAIVNIRQGNKDQACSDLSRAVELGYTPAYAIYQKECQKK